jgi:hypothetical protein
MAHVVITTFKGEFAADLLQVQRRETFNAIYNCRLAVTSGGGYHRSMTNNRLCTAPALRLSPIDMSRLSRS